MNTLHCSRVISWPKPLSLSTASIFSTALIFSTASFFSSGWGGLLSAAEKPAAEKPTDKAAQSDAATLKFADAPAAIQKTFRDEAPNAKIETLTKATDDSGTAYLGYATIDGKSYGLKVAADGMLLVKTLDEESKVSEVEVKLADVPAAVRSTLQAESKGGMLNTVLKTTLDGKVAYGAGATVKTKAYWLTVAADGTLIEKRLDLPVDEDEVDMAECPAAVRATLQEEAGGVKIDTVNKSTEGDKSVYGTSVTIGRKNYEIVVAEDGTLIGKKLEAEPERNLVKFSECPAPVQKTLRAESKQAEIDAVAKETLDGRAAFTAVVKIAGKSYEIKVADDGRLIWKILADGVE
jgi:hypothetical protein